MPRKAVSGIMITLLLMGILASALNVQTAVAATIIVPDDYPTIQEAINSANEGDTIYVKARTYYENIVINKTVSLIGENNTNTIINGTVSEFAVYISADNVTFKQFTVATTPWEYVYCIYLKGCRYNIVADNKISTWGMGIYLKNSDENAILHNAFGGGYHWHSITLINSSDNTIIGNRQEALADVAASIDWGSCRNLVASNMFNINFAFSVRIEEASNDNIIIKNTIEGWGGLFIGDSNGTIVHHNNIYGFSMAGDVSVVGSYGTSWDAGYPYGGNYWYSYNGMDVCKGPYQNETGGDGIGDTPFVIDENDIDRYPLMEPYQLSPHDIGIISVNKSKTIVGHGYTTSINVKIANFGEETETFNFTIQANSATIQKQITTLTTGKSVTITFTWNTTGFAKGNYTITASVDIIPDETDTTDNTYTDGWVIITIPGDVNGDNTVNILDAIILAGTFGSSINKPDYNPNADINCDGRVNILDAIILAQHFGQTDL